MAEGIASTGRLRSCMHQSRPYLACQIWCVMLGAVPYCMCSLPFSVIPPSQTHSKNLVAAKDSRDRQSYSTRHTMHTSAAAFNRVWTTYGMTDGA